MLRERILALDSFLDRLHSRFNTLEEYFNALRAFWAGLRLKRPKTLHQRALLQQNIANIRAIEYHLSGYRQAYWLARQAMQVEYWREQECLRQSVDEANIFRKESLPMLSRYWDQQRALTTLKEKYFLKEPCAYTGILVTDECGQILAPEVPGFDAPASFPPP